MWIEEQLKFKLKFQFQLKFKLKFSSETLSSPNYPEDYPGGLDETYSLEVAADKILQITFEDFEMEDCACCDWLKVNQASFDHVKVCLMPFLALHNLWLNLQMFSEIH